uniref:Uncharacterized protein n=1 Tax=Panagrolaimus sp. PS1159 TaxID=55785 RepID=A0AC35F3C1_9BILA
MASSYQRRENAIELFVTNKSCRIDYKGPCTVDVKLISKMFIAESYDKNAESIEISLSSSFVQHKNILCHFSSDESNNIFLVFPTVAACKSVYDILLNYQVEVKQEGGGRSTVEKINDELFILLLKEAKSNPTFKKRVKACVLNLLEDITAVAAEQPDDGISNVKSEMDETFGGELRTSSTVSSSEPLLSDAMDFTYSNGDYEQEVAVKEEPEASFVSSMDVDINESLYTPECTQAISRKRPSDTIMNPSGVKQCKTEVLLDEQRPALPAQPETYHRKVIMPAKKIVKSTHFLILKTSKSKYELIVFLSDTKTLCHRYFFQRLATGDRFKCIECKNRNHTALAKVKYNIETGEYFIELGVIKHVCSPIIYDNDLEFFIEPCTSYPSLFFRTPTVDRTKRVLTGKAARFSGISNTAESSQTPTLVNQLSTSTSSQPSTSGNVTNELIIVPAAAPKKILKQPDCSNDSNSAITKPLKFPASNALFVKPTISPILIDQRIRSSSPSSSTSKSPKAATSGPRRTFKSPDFNLQWIKHLDLYVIKSGRSIANGTNNEIAKPLNSPILVDQLSRSSCSPSSSTSKSPKKASLTSRTILMSGKFKLFSDNDTVTDLKLLTFPFDDENAKCRIYQYSKALRVFFCVKCFEEFNHVAVADMFINAKRETYILECNPTKHICKPILYSTINSNNFVMVSSDKLEPKKFNAKTWNKNNRIIVGNFEFQRNSQGTLNGHLIVFNSTDKNMCYKYSMKYSQYYLCQQCQISAKVIREENGKHFVELSLSNHRCNPVVYQPERNVIRKPNFINLNERNPIVLIVFTSEAHDECYVYSSKNLKCCKCLGNVYASIGQDEEDEECVYLCRQEHECQPQKFEDVAKKYELKL